MLDLFWTLSQLITIKNCGQKAYSSAPNSSIRSTSSKNLSAAALLFYFLNKQYQCVLQWIHPN